MNINFIILGSGYEGQAKPTHSSEQRANLYNLNINPKGAEFITGATPLRTMQEKAMSNLKSNLWGGTQ